MTPQARLLVLPLLILGLLPSAFAQRHHDPLNDKEIDELRDTRMEPEKRVKLFVQFTQARFQTIDTLRSNPQLSAKSIDELEQLLGDVATLVDELDDNLVEYDAHHEELRKGLHAVIDAEVEFQTKLKAIKDSPLGRQRAVSFAVANASESIESSLTSAKAMLEDQNARKGKEPVEKREKAGRDSKPPRPDYTGTGGLGDERQKNLR